MNVMDSLTAASEIPPGVENTRILVILNSGKETIEHIVVALVTGHFSQDITVPGVCQVKSFSRDCC